MGPSDPRGWQCHCVIWNVANRRDLGAWVSFLIWALAEATWIVCICPLPSCPGYVTEAWCQYLNNLCLRISGRAAAEASSGAGSSGQAAATGQARALGQEESSQLRKSRPESCGDPKTGGGAREGGQDPKGAGGAGAEGQAGGRDGANEKASKSAKACILRDCAVFSKQERMVHSLLLWKYGGPAQMLSWQMLTHLFP